MCLFGASSDTGNLGVSALMSAVLAGIARRVPRAEITVFDHGWGVREGQLRTNSGTPLSFRKCGARLSRRWHRPESYQNMRFCNLFGGLGNPGMQAIRRADAVLDISGGDSFSDIYGRKRFRSITLPKQMALACGTPLVLLPQTYGPFSQPRSQRVAASILRRARAVWARDPGSLDVVRGLLGEAFTPDRHRLGVDVAFALESHEPSTPLPDRIEGWLQRPRREPLIGLNFSGLLYNDPLAASRFGLKVDYRRFARELVQLFLRRSDARILLVPHVLVPQGELESDPAAARDLIESLGEEDRARVAALEPSHDQHEVKWIISRLDWFSGARMHATIAALSSGVPVGGVAYSPKFAGVFACCGQGEHTADARALDREGLLEKLWWSWQHRAEAVETYRRALPDVLARAEDQLDRIVEACIGNRASL